MTMEFRKPPLVEVTYTYRCCVASCDSVYSVTIPAGIDYELMSPVVPDGWTEIFRGTIFCPKHKLGVMTDGETIPV